MCKRLEGKVALVCGASPNIGGTTAHFMAREGARIAVNDAVPQVAEETARFLQSRGYEAVAIPGDAANEKETPSIVQRAVTHFGYVDVLVNMVGRQYRFSVADANVHDWRRVLDGFLTGGMLTTKYAAQAMMEKGRRGSIIHICSDAAHQGEPGNSAYSAAKAGLLNFARAAAMELAACGIRVNTISPTGFDHNLWRFGRGTQLRTRLRWVQDDILKAVPLGRFCRAMDVAHLAVFLASDESSYLTAVDIPLDGGAMRKYWMWRPGDYTGITLDDYVKTVTPYRYGEPASWEEVSQTPSPP